MSVELFHIFENIIQFFLFFQIPLLYIQVSNANGPQKKSSYFRGNLLSGLLTIICQRLWEREKLPANPGMDGWNSSAL